MDATEYLADGHSSYRRNALVRVLACVPDYSQLAMAARRRIKCGAPINRATIEAAYIELVDAYDDEREL